MGACALTPASNNGNGNNNSNGGASPSPVIIGRSNVAAGHKVVVVGTSAVGKSSILMRYVKNTFTADTVPTLAAAFFKRVVYVDGRDVTLYIWDTSGDEK